MNRADKLCSRIYLHIFIVSFQKLFPSKSDIRTNQEVNVNNMIKSRRMCEVPN